MVRSGVRFTHSVWRSPRQQTFVLIVGLVAVLVWSYVKLAPNAANPVEARLSILAAGAAAAIAVWGVVNQWAISRRQLTIQHIANLETDREYLSALRRFNIAAEREQSLKQYAKGEPPEGVRKRKNSEDQATYDKRQRDWMDDQSAIRKILNQDEFIAIGIRKSILDYRLVCACWRGTITRRYSVSLEYIAELRRVTRMPTMFIEIERFAEKLNRDYYHSLL